MKYMVEYKVRSGGLTFEQQMANSEALLKSFSKWKPEDGLKMLAFVGRVSGGGGYALVECDDPKTLHGFLAKFIHWNDCEVVPVLDVAESTASTAAGLAWARDASRG